ncbi:MAG TPA: tetratricopeptide repeat protein [Micropepsaceae bacterium]|nr:tetratricopeptide repeat protein [Micropepsaceae bacterium]
MSAGAAFDLASRLREAIALHRQGRLTEAERLYRDCLVRKPDQPDALHFLGVLEGQQGRHDSALQLMNRAVAVSPANSGLLYNRANLLRDMGRLEDARAGYDAALAVKADNVAALGNRGVVLHMLARYDQALASFDRVLALKPDDADAHANRGNALVALSNPQEALSSYDKALAAAPDHGAALFGKGNALAKLGRFADALPFYDRAIQHDPANFELFSNRGIAFMQLRRHEDALAAYTRALELKPGDADALYGRGSALLELNRQDDAIASFQQLLQQHPDYPYALGMLVHAQKTACDWREESAIRMMIEAIGKDQRVTTPLVLLAVSDSAPLKLHCAQTVIRHKFRPTQQRLWRGDIYRHERIRIGYLSADFRNHAVSILMAGVFEHHDAARFETVAFSYGPDDGSAMRARLTKSFHRFIDVRSHSDAEAAKLIRDMEIDMLVDLTGLTASARPLILAARPAPVQVNYLGFAGSMGADYVDYILADRTVIPDGQHGFYAEKVVYLPHCYMPHDSQRRVALTIPSRRELGLPDAGFVFASFNNAYKFSPAMFDIWMRLLREIEGSVLWLSTPNAAAQRNLKREAEARGVAANAIVFAPYLPAGDDHLARLGAADLFLDTLPYNAHTTASDALWAGLPVLTCEGNSFASRVAASLLRACDMPELIADTLESYESKALAVARNPNALAELKTKLRRNRDDCALFDTLRFTRNLENAYIAMWQRTQQGQAPAAIQVQPWARP